MFDTIKGIVGDIAAGAIKDQRIALSQEQLSALDLKLRDTLEQLAERDQKMAELQSRYERLQAENRNLRQQINELTVSDRQQRAARRYDQEEQILLLLTNRMNRTAREIAAKLAVSVDRCEVLLQALDEAGLVGCRSFYRMEFELVLGDASALGVTTFRGGVGVKF